MSALAGTRVLVTRAAEQAGEIAERLRALGATVIEAPAIRLVDPPDWQPLDTALDRLSTYDWIVFTSQNAVPRLLARMRARDVPEPGLAASRHAAIGEATAEALRAHRLRVDLVADEYRAESVALALGREPLQGKRILIPRALVAREVLPERLRAAGAEVDVTPVYQTVADPEGAALARRAIAEGVDVVTFTSASTVRGFFEAIGPARSKLAGVCLASIGPITSEAIRAEGAVPEVEASPYTVPALVEALARHRALRAEDR
ncbi:MAG TPA: uroporphyrinogen-III synthase [Candidatus Eisenbacteria bacterium]|nr:uroporphyrinogen-III synthase [Candidatus Eisenbacteria bacterium]